MRRVQSHWRQQGQDFFLKIALYPRGLIGIPRFSLKETRALFSQRREQYVVE